MSTRSLQLLLLATLCALSAPALAQDQEPAESEKDPLEAMLSEAGLLLAPQSPCMDLTSPSALHKRRKQWSAAIEKLAASDPQRLHSWLIGATTPPEAVMREAMHQRDCMIGAMLKDAAREDVELMMDLDEGLSSKSAMRKRAETFESSPGARRAVLRRIDRSHYRDAAGQAFIWRRKFTFTHPRSFNLISDAGAKTCGLTPGHTWRPSSERHQRCWRAHLSPEERQREIMTASSAPGISRHHWGTEFDLFGLNPRHFFEGKRLYDEWMWMQTRGIHHGFFQPFLGTEVLGPHTYIEERWHWSYYPISHAILLYMRAHEAQVGAALNAQWDRFEESWMGKKRKGDPYFTYIRKHWRAYVFDIAHIELSAIPWVSPSSLAILLLLA